MTELSTSPLCVPFTKMAVRGSSTSFGCRASKTRFERAFLGLLLYRSETFFRYRYILTSYVAYLHKVNSALVEGKRKMQSGQTPPKAKFGETARTIIQLEFGDRVLLLYTATAGFYRSRSMILIRGDPKINPARYSRLIAS